MDLRYALRQLGRAPAFTTVAVLTLALGIAGDTVFFAAVNAMVFRPMRGVDLDGLYHVTFIQRDPGRSGPLSAEQFRRLDADPPASIARLGAIVIHRAPVVAAIPRRAEQLGIEVMSSGFPVALGMTPQAGRFFVREDDVDGASPSVVISDRLWREWFDSDQSVFGRATIRLNGVPFTVIGVAPRGYQGLRGLGTDVWVTIASAPRLATDGTRQIYLIGHRTTFVRPRPAASRAEVETAIRTLLTSQPGDADPAFTTIRLSPAAAFFGQSQLTATGHTIIALASFLLFAACANLANLLFARGADRAGEVAIRVALGASRLQVFRLFLIENALVSALASLVGLVLALGGTSLIAAAFPSVTFQLFRGIQVRRFVDLSPDVRVVLFAFSAGAAAALSVGALAAWKASSAPTPRALASSGLAVGATSRGRSLRVGMVIVQVVVAVLLLMGTGLSLRVTEAALDRYVVSAFPRIPSSTGPSHP